jgi:hypothetical protein
MTDRNEDWRHAYIGAMARAKKEAQQRREGVRWAIGYGVALGVIVSAVLALLGVS